MRLPKLSAHPISAHTYPCQGGANLAGGRAQGERAPGSRRAARLFSAYAGFSKAKRFYPYQRRVANSLLYSYRRIAGVIHYNFMRIISVEFCIRRKLVPENAGQDANTARPYGLVLIAEASV